MITPVRIKKTEGAELPQYQTEGAAGMDIRSFLPDEESIILEPFHRVLVPTGLFPEIPEHHHIEIRPRSGLAYKHGITVLNSPATIDSDYRGEMKVLLINLSNEPYEIKHGERIAQMVLIWHEIARWIETEELSETDRIGGFGSSGKM